MKILLTGSAGFLGTFIRNQTSLDKDNFIFGTTSNCNANNTLVQFNPFYKDAEIFIKNDLFAIIHCAAIIPPSFSVATHENVFLPNIQMMEYICQLAQKRNAQKIVYLSSFGSMSNPDKLDIGDYYTLSKITGELYCKMQESRGIQTASLRISAPFGEWQHQKTVIRIFIERAIKNDPLMVFGSGLREQNFTYAGDILNAIEAALNAEGIVGVYNIVGSESISMLDLAKKIICLSGSKSEIVCGVQPDPQESYRPRYEYTRAAKDFNYCPGSLEKGLMKFIEWVKKQERMTDSCAKPTHGK